MEHLQEHELGTEIVGHATLELVETEVNGRESGAGCQVCREVAGEGVIPHDESPEVVQAADTHRDGPAECVGAQDQHPEG